jgi:hypothetical protein
LGGKINNDFRRGRIGQLPSEVRKISEQYAKEVSGKRRAWPRAFENAWSRNSGQDLLRKDSRGHRKLALGHVLLANLSAAKKWTKKSTFI